MARPPSQRLLPPSGPKIHFRSLDHAGGDSLNTGPVNTGPDLKSPPQTTLKGDQSFKDCCEMKGTSTRVWLLSVLSNSEFTLASFIFWPYVAKVALCWFASWCFYLATSCHGFPGSSWLVWYGCKNYIAICSENTSCSLFIKHLQPVANIADISSWQYSMWQGYSTKIGEAPGTSVSLHTKDRISN